MILSRRKRPQAGNYWSSTTSAPITTLAWFVYMGLGSMYDGLKTTNYYVLAVRSGR